MVATTAAIPGSTRAILANTCNHPQPLWESVGSHFYYHSPSVLWLVLFTVCYVTIGKSGLKSR